ncbi:hypothetical protein [Streptomyces cyaneofuscatus]|uniref:hypothetical protein n=1 Tax=Streptomyces cyaneofuscatus TaxID=66883 RepID=UPI0037A3AEE0
MAFGFGVGGGGDADAFGTGEVFVAGEVAAGARTRGATDVARRQRRRSGMGDALDVGQEVLDTTGPSPRTRNQLAE